MQKAVCYIRVSTEEQSRNGVSLAAQEETLKAYCLLQKLEIVSIIREEGVSAGKPLATRPGGKELLRLIAKKKASHVVGYKLDRLFRNAEDALNQSRAWDAAGVALHLVDMGGTAINTGSAMGKMFFTMVAAFAELERNLIAERTASALRHKKENGQVYGTTPLGYIRQGNNLVADEKELEVVAQVKQWRGEGLTLRLIADRLNGQRIPTKKGGKWHASTVKYLLENNLYREAV